MTGTLWVFWKEVSHCLRSLSCPSTNLWTDALQLPWSSLLTVSWNRRLDFNFRLFLDAILLCSNGSCVELMDIRPMQSVTYGGGRSCTRHCNALCCECHNGCNVVRMEIARERESLMREIAFSVGRWEDYSTWHDDDFHLFCFLRHVQRPRLPIAGDAERVSTIIRFLEVKHWILRDCFWFWASRNRGLLLEVVWSLFCLTFIILFLVE